MIDLGMVTCPTCEVRVLPAAIRPGGCRGCSPAAEDFEPDPADLDDHWRPHWYDRSEDT